jgi:hypothetical protein
VDGGWCLRKAEQSRQNGVQMMPKYVLRPWISWRRVAQVDYRIYIIDEDFDVVSCLV